MVTKALGFAALIGVATSLNAGNITLTAGDGPVGLPSEITGDPAGAVAQMSWGPINQGSTLNPGDFTATIESVVTTYGGNKLAFWYKVSSADRSRLGLTSDPIQFMGVYLPSTTTQVEVNQGSGPYAASQGSFLGPVGFAYTANPIPGGEKSTWAVVYTDSIWTGNLDDTVTLGKIRVTANTDQDYFGFVPLAIPEPATYAGMFALGLAGFAAYRRFRA